MTLRLDHRDAEATANVLTGPLEARLEQPIVLYDNTLREGEQPPGVVFDGDDKLEIARHLDEVGIPWANVGFPAVSREEQLAVQRIASAGLRMKTAALSRLVESDIDATVDAGVDMVSLFLAGSDVHLAHKHRMDEATALARVEAAIARVKSHGLLCSFSLEDGSRTPFDRIARIFEVARDAGADWIVVADTVGVLTPSSTLKLYRALAARFALPLGTHFHDDLGLSLANALSALEGGAQVVHATVNGVGERAGNTCIEELAMVLAVKYGRDLGLRLDRLYDLCLLVHRLSGSEPPPHKAVAGKWCFTHESGIHVQGILASPECYQPYPPALIGRGHEIAFGKHSGVQSVALAASRLGLTLPEEGLRNVVTRIKEAAERKVGQVTDEQVFAWLRAEVE